MSSTAAIGAQAAIVRQIGGPFVIEPVEIAAPRDHEVRVQIVAVGMCHTDLVARDGFPVPMPIVLGHEGSGIVESVGAKVSSIKPGDHVVLSFNSCNSCPNCDDHKPAYCYQFLPHNFGGIRPADGSTALSQNGQQVHANFFGQSSFGTYAIAHERNTVVVEKDAPLELLGPLGCGIQTGAGAVLNSIGLKAGQSLAVFGGGAVGLSAVLAAKAVGANPIIVVEPNEARGKLALELGASHVINPKQEDALARIREIGGGGVTHTIETTGIPAIVATAYDTMLPNGTLGLIAVPPPDGMFTANLTNMLVRGVVIRYITEGDADPKTFIPQLIALHKAGKFPFEKLIKKFPFSQINEAAKASETGEAIKPVLVF